MSQDRHRDRARSGLLWGSLIFLAGSTGLADVIILRGGGEIQCNVIADPTKPETIGSHWRLAVKRGQHGKDGIHGKDGERGPEGRPGRDKY